MTHSQSESVNTVPDIQILNLILGYRQIKEYEIIVLVLCVFYIQVINVII